MAQPLVLSAVLRADASGFTGPVKDAGQSLQDLGTTAQVTDGQVKAPPMTRRRSPGCGPRWTI